MQFTTKILFAQILASKNLVTELTEEERKRLGSLIWDEWNVDKTSRSEWEDRMKLSFNLALQVMEKKTFPWPNASNVKFPLVTIAALQYQSRAYPALLPGAKVVKCRVFGEDADNLKGAQAEKIAAHMSYQVLEEDACWEDDMDKALIAQSIVGCAFKKSYFSSSLQHNVSEHVFAKDLYISYYAKSLRSAPRITQVLYLSANDLEERRRRGLFVEWDVEPTPQAEKKPPVVGALETLDQSQDNQQGIQRPSTPDTATPYRILEQHRWLDLDGDGFQEPYVVFVREDTQTLLRIVARFREADVKKNDSGEIYSITAEEYFTKYPFVPSPDGGIYDLGFGSLLSPLNESINTSINLLIDAATVANTAGGFLGRGVKFRSGETSFKPWEWKRLDSTGDDLRKGIVPLPVREPSMVVFSLLKLLIDYGERIGMATDPQVGVPTGQNTPAETSRNMIREGQRVFTAIYKRTYRSLRDEFRKLFKLNRIFLQPEGMFFNEAASVSQRIFQADYLGTEDGAILPAADPAMSSDEEKLQRMYIVSQRAATVPGYNAYEVEKRILQSMYVPDIEQILPDPKGPNAIPAKPDSKVIVETMKLESKKLQTQLALQTKMAELMQQAELNSAKILELHASATKLLADAEGIPRQDQINALNAAIQAAKVRQEGVHNSMKLLKEIYQTMNEGTENGGANQQGGLPLMDDESDDAGVLSLPASGAVGGEGSMGE